MSHGQVREDALASERDFYRRLLDLGGEHEIEPLLDQALALIVEVTGARTGVPRAVRRRRDRAAVLEGLSAAAISDLATIRASISRGIIARAISEGRTVETASAPRRRTLRRPRQRPPARDPGGAVRARRGGAADRRRSTCRATRPECSPTIDRERAELFARQLAPLADRLVRRDDPDRIDHTVEVAKPAALPRDRRPLARRWRSSCNRAATVAPLDVDVLITGPSGTGKSMLARAIREQQPALRAGRSSSSTARRFRRR